MLLALRRELGPPSTGPLVTAALGHVPSGAARGMCAVVCPSWLALRAGRCAQCSVPLDVDAALSAERLLAVRVSLSSHSPAPSSWSLCLSRWCAERRHLSVVSHRCHAIRHVPSGIARGVLCAAAVCRRSTLPLYVSCRESPLPSGMCRAVLLAAYRRLSSVGRPRVGAPAVVRYGATQPARSTLGYDAWVGYARPTVRP